MKLIYFDFENGGKTIGSESELKELFGFPVIALDSYSGFQSVMGQIFKPVTSDRTIEIAPGVSVTLPKRTVVKRDNVDVEAIALDTFTELVKKYQRELKGSGRMQLNKWGELKDTVDSLLEYLNGFPINVILNVHTRQEKDEDSGIVEQIPNIEGSTRYDIAKWFDFVFYADTIRDDENKLSFVWHTKKDDRYSHAKDRTTKLPEIIPQDYSIVFEAAKKRGWDSIKVLVIGKPGSGKTYSLQTLSKIGG